MLCSEEPDNITLSCLCSHGAVLRGARQHMRQAGTMRLQKESSTVHRYMRAGCFAGLLSWCEETSDTIFEGGLKFKKL